MDNLPPLFRLLANTYAGFEEELTYLKAGYEDRIQDLRAALSYHQEQTRPIHSTQTALAKTDVAEALKEHDLTVQRVTLLEAAAQFNGNAGDEWVAAKLRNMAWGIRK